MRRFLFVCVCAQRASLAPRTTTSIALVAELSLQLDGDAGATSIQYYYYTSTISTIILVHNQLHVASFVGRIFFVTPHIRQALFYLLLVPTYNESFI